MFKHNKQPAYLENPSIDPKSGAYVALSLNLDPEIERSSISINHNSLTSRTDHRYAHRVP